MKSLAAKLKDTWRFYGLCGRCEQEKFFIRRMVVASPEAKVVSNSFYCTQCMRIISDKL